MVFFWFVDKHNQVDDVVDEGESTHSTKPLIYNQPLPLVVVVVVVVVVVRPRI
jgi:hypothetical protein